ncbi:MAG: thiamine phosphate synthase, partial [Bacteroides sp.]|nr:thiamine phosphate synthase [Bacteroides sp.]
MKLIVITPPLFFKGEIAATTSLFCNGLEILHLRKPGASAQELENYLKLLPQEYLPHIVVHDHFQLVPAFGLKGIHLNNRNPQLAPGYTGHVSCSCHSLDEVVLHKPHCDYVFLSPIYDSISKERYSSAYSLDTLKEARQAGIIDAKVIALSGITPAHLPEIASLGFGGASLQDSVWQQPEAH